MQDKITIADAPDCLNTNDKAMWVLGYEATIEARGQCLHQIQEPAPVLAAQPIAWPKNAQDVRDFFRSDFITAQFAAEDQTPCDEDRYHISAHDFLSAVNWWADFPHIPRTPEAAPAAVAVPDDRAAFERELIDNHHYVPSDFSFKDGFYGGDDDYIQFGWDVWQARAALDATPAAVPVVLPEPDAAVSELMRLVEMASIQRASTAVLIYTGQPKELSDKSSAQEQETVRSIESKLRALLATATGLPAQAVPAFCHVASLKLKSLQERGYQITGYALEKPVEGAQPERGFINHGGFVGWWWDGQSPQAQADARDAALAASEQDALRLVRQAVRDFHYALDNRKHGGVAAGAAMNAIELALNMYWQQGQEADRRANQAAQGGE